MQKFITCLIWESFTFSQELQDVQRARFCVPKTFTAFMGQAFLGKCSGYLKLKITWFAGLRILTCQYHQTEKSDPGIEFMENLRNNIKQLELKVSGTQILGWWLILDVILVDHGLRTQEVEQCMEQLPRVNLTRYPLNDMLRWPVPEGIKAQRLKRVFTGF